MSKAHPTAPAKPSKPNPAFPLYAHRTGRWAKKVRGQTLYFGDWSDPDAALDKYLREKDDLHAGRKPRSDPAALIVKELCNAYLDHKAALRDAGELSPRTWSNYKEVCDLIVSRFGKRRFVSDLRQEDFAALRRWMARRWGPVRLGDFIQRVRSVFKYGYDSEMLATPMRFGPGFARPSKKTLRLERARRGVKMFEADEIRRMLEKAPTPNLRAMILLGVNCGLGNSDCGKLPVAAIDLDRGWIDFARPKTGIARRCPLWPETSQALRDVLVARKEPKDRADAGLLFVTLKGQSYHKSDDRNPISAEMRKLLNSLGVNGARNFYSLRHTFRTIADESKDQPAVDHVMGHAPRGNDMSAIYRERIGDERLRAVSDHVRQWLFAEGRP